jgi:peptidoglycan/xylan/chitin deacetylase (PgdA/CDA1 family)
MTERTQPSPVRSAIAIAEQRSEATTPDLTGTSQSGEDLRPPTSVSIVIACYSEKRWDQLITAIDSGLSQTYRADVIVVVDNNQNLCDRLQSYCSRVKADFPITILRNDRAQGASGARNTGAMTVRSDLIAFLDDDARAEPTWLAELVPVFDDKAVLGAGGAIEPSWEASHPTWFPHEFGWVVGATPVVNEPSPRRVRNVWACNMIMRRDEFVKVNGFREDFGKLKDCSEPEDTDLCIRVSAIAPATHWVRISGGRVHHAVPVERSTVSFFFKRCWNEGVGKASLASVSDKRSEALSSERDYLRSVLPRGVYQHLRASARGDVAGLARAGFIVGGTLSTCLGFTCARVGIRTVSRRPGASVPDSQPSQLRIPTACPILMYHSIPTGTDRTRDPWQVPLEELQGHLVALVNDGWTLLGLTAALAALQEDPTQRVVALTFDDGYIDFMGAVDVLESVGARATLYVPTAHIGTAGIKDDSPGAIMSWFQLAEVAARGVEIGSHAHHHRPVDILDSATLREEVQRSKTEIEAHVQQAVHSFCFPHGYTSRRVRTALVESGYTNACIVGRRVATADDDVFALPRLQVLPGTSDAELMTLMELGEPGWTPAIKRVLQPAWRLTRLSAHRILNRALT